MNAKTIKLGEFSKTTGLVALLSIFINLAFLVVGRKISVPPATFGPYMYSSVIGLTVLGIFLAACVYFMMRRFYADTEKANKHFLIISVIALLVSFYPDITLPYSPEPDDIGWTYGIIANLMLMHIPPALLVMYFFTRGELTQNA